MSSTSELLDTKKSLTSIYYRYLSQIEKIKVLLQENEDILRKVCPHIWEPDRTVHDPSGSVFVCSQCGLHR